MADEQGQLFNTEEFEAWRKEWEGMPEYYQEDQSAELVVQVNFDSEDDMRKFAEFIGQNLTTKTKSIWWPKKERMVAIDKLWVSESPDELI